MELWIRSQKNDEVGIVPRLIKATDIALDYCGGNDSYYISVNDCIDVAYYQSEKRALEVLDEIQDILKKNQPSIISYSNGDIVNINGNYVYEMPKE